VKDAGWCTETESTGSSPRAQLPVRCWSRSTRGPTCHRSQSLQDSASLQRGSAQTHQNRAEERSLLSHSTTTCAPSTDMQPIHVSMRADVALCASEAADSQGSCVGQTEGSLEWLSAHDPNAIWVENSSCMCPLMQMWPCVRAKGCSEFMDGRCLATRGPLDSRGRRHLNA